MRFTTSDASNPTVGNKTCAECTLRIHALQLLSGGRLAPLNREPCSPSHGEYPSRVLHGRELAHHLLLRLPALLGVQGSSAAAYDVSHLGDEPAVYLSGRRREGERASTNVWTELSNEECERIGQC